MRSVLLVRDEAGAGLLDALAGGPLDRRVLLLIHRDDRVERRDLLVRIPVGVLRRPALGLVPVLRRAGMERFAEAGRGVSLRSSFLAKDALLHRGAAAHTAALKVSGSDIQSSPFLPLLSTPTSRNEPWKFQMRVESGRRPAGGALGISEGWQRGGGRGAYS